MRRYASDAELLTDLFAGEYRPERHPAPVDLGGDPIDVAAELIARIFESPELSPNGVVLRPEDHPLSRAEWRKAAHRAGELLHHEVQVFTSQGRLVAMIVPTEEERAAEEQRLGSLMESIMKGEPMPPPLPRRYR